MEKIKIYGYLPEYSYLVKIEPEKVDEVKNLPFVRWIGPYHPYYKISPECENIKENLKGGIYVKDYGFKEFYDPFT